MTNVETRFEKVFYEMGMKLYENEGKMEEEEYKK